MHPRTLEQIGLAAVTRRAELDQIRAGSQDAAVAVAPATLMARMKKFLRF
jgi:hypothetical protein